MSDQSVKTKRAGDLAATSPNCFKLGDHSATEPEEQPPVQARAGLLIKILRVAQRLVTSGFWWLEQRIAAFDLEIERLRM